MSAQSECLRHVASHGGGKGVESDLAWFSVLPDDSSRIVTGNGVASAGANFGGDGLGVNGGREPMSADKAVRLAVKLAVDAGEYEKAAALVEVLRLKCVKTC
jgi:hypothetical protein